jgi:glycosyltransferase involved in cell wall biosynthesis
MHIGILLSTPLPPREGIGFYTWNLAKHLKKNGHEVTLITRGSLRKTTWEEIDGITIFRPTFVPLYPFHVHIHSVFVNRLLKKIGGGLDVLHLHTPLVRYPKTKLPGLVTFHTTMKANTMAQTQKTILEFVTRWQTHVSITLEKHLISKVKIITSVAKSVAEELKQYDVDPKSVLVLGNAVDTRIFFPGELGHPDQQRDRYIFTAGRLAPRKGLEDLLACAKIVRERDPSLQFWIAGSGPYEKHLRDLANSLEVGDTVRFLGHISKRQELVSLYRGAVCYLHPAHYEGLPTVLLEAMACGRPVIATGVSGALDVIKDGINGLLVPPHNPEQLANKVVQISNDQTLRAKLGAEALKTIREKYSWELVARNYQQLYSTLHSKVN